MADSPPTNKRGLFLLVLAGSLSFVSTTDRSEAQGLTQELTAAEVRCQEDQLAAMLQRMRITGAGPFGQFEDGIPWSISLSHGRPVGGFAGLGRTNANVNNPNILNPQPVPVERHLAFHVDTLPEQLLLDPHRLPLPQATIVREEPSSNLVLPTSEFRLAVSLDTSLAGNLGPVATVNNFLVPEAGRPYNGFLTSSARPGRGVLAVAGTVCTSKQSEQDHHVLAILRRLLRVTVIDQDDGCELCAYHASHEISLFRGEGTHEYRVNVYPYRHKGGPTGRIAGRITVDWDSSGQLTTGVLEVFGKCAAGESRACSDSLVEAHLLLGPPGFAGVSHPPTQQLGFVSLQYIPAIGSGSSAPVPFATFLSQSTWN